MKSPAQYHRNQILVSWLAVLVLISICNSAVESRVPSSTELLNIHIKTRLREYNLKPSKRSTDAEFLRRIHLELTRHHARYSALHNDVLYGEESMDTGKKAVKPGDYRL